MVPGAGSWVWRPRWHGGRALHHKNLGLSDGDKARLTVELTAGKAAVGVLAQSDTAPAISDRLTQLGGAPEAHELTDEALQTAATGAPA